MDQNKNITDGCAHCFEELRGRPRIAGGDRVCRDCFLRYETDRAQYTRHLRALGRAMVAAAVAVVLGCVAAPARADEMPEAVLTRALVAEAGPILVADHPAILEVLQVRADRAGERIDVVAQRYCSVFRRPQGWHGRMIAAMPIDQLVDYAPDVYMLVSAWLRGTRLPSRCYQTPDHWGAPGGHDMARAVRAGWTPVRCGQTANRFWRST